MFSRPFAIPSRDGRALLNGQVDLPGDSASRYPTVLMVPGGGFMDRDGWMGNSGTERDLIYRLLARAFTASGMAVVRFDNRGVRGNELTMPSCPAGLSEAEAAQHYLNSCVDPRVRSTVTVQTQQDDIEDVWRFACGHVNIDPTRIVIWAHSEGGLNTARLVGAKRIDPRGLIFVGSLTEDPAGLFHWQVVDRYAERVMSWDADGDGLVTLADVQREFPNDFMFAAVGMNPEIVQPLNGHWTREAIYARFAAEYETLKAAALATPDDASYPDPAPGVQLVIASYNWWKQWFVETTPTIDHFQDYSGYVSFHLGEIDSQLPAERQLAFVETRIQAVRFRNPPSLVLHQQRGHSLRTGEPIAGPMDDAAIDLLVEEAKTLLAPLH